MFKEELIVLCHMAGGAPARGTEVVSIRTENGESARAQRGVFIDNVELVTGYHKDYSKSGEAKVIAFSRLGSLFQAPRSIVWGHLQFGGRFRN